MQISKESMEEVKEIADLTYIAKILLNVTSGQIMSTVIERTENNQFIKVVRTPIDIFVLKCDSHGVIIWEEELLCKQFPIRRLNETREKYEAIVAKLTRKATDIERYPHTKYFSDIKKYEPKFKKQEHATCDNLRRDHVRTAIYNIIPTKFVEPQYYMPVDPQEDGLLNYGKIK